MIAIAFVVCKVVVVCYVAIKKNETANKHHGLRYLKKLQSSAENAKYPVDCKLRSFAKQAPQHLMPAHHVNTLSMIPSSVTDTSLQQVPSAFHVSRIQSSKWSHSTL